MTGLVATRAAEVRRQPGEWFWWPNRHSTSDQTRRWLARIGPEFEVKAILVADTEHGATKWRHHILVRWGKRFGNDPL